MEAKFTKGEWKINSAFRQEVNTRNGVTIADCSKSIMIDNAEKEANAKLIAAAPLMIKALLEWQEANAIGSAEMLSQARITRDIAIKKATE